MSKANINIEMLKRAVLEKKVKEQIKQYANETRSLHMPITKTDRHAPLVLSFAQQRLWFIGQFDSAASRAYHIPVALRLTGKLEHQALISALDNLVARQESLRTHFTLVDDQPCQKIAPPDTGFSMSYLDLRSLSEDERSARVDELAESEARMPFDLTQGPLIRGQLLHLDNEEHVLLFTQHHIISDGWSSGILIRELAAFYQAALTGHDADLPPLPIQYADYAAWQRSALHCDELTVQRDYWYNQLNGAPSLLELPTDRPRPSVQSYSGNKIPVHFDGELLTALKTFAQNQGATLFMTLLTAWTIVLSRLSGQNDIVIGLPIANRTRTELDNLIGFFVNTLALRIESGQCHTIAELLAHVRKQTLAAYAHQDLPFEQVVEALQPERSLSHSPIFQVMLALDNTPAQELKLPGLELSIIEQPQYSAQCDLTLSFTETAGNSGLIGTLIYATDLFDRETVVRIAGYFQNVITAMIADVNQTISSLPMLSAMEQQQLLVDFNATQADFPQNALVHELFEQQVAQTPEAIAVVCEGKTLSYDQLNRQANQLAHYLIGLGIQPDDRVAICVERSPALIVCLLGILKAGGAYVPLDPTYPAERLTYMLKDAAPVILLTQVAQRDKLPDIVPVRVIDAQDTSSETLSLVTQPSHNPDIQALGLTSRHLAYVIYTSGSTGQPKGVMIEHRNVNRLAINGGYADIGPNDCVAHCSNIAFDASTWEIWSALLNGGRLHVIPQAVLLNPERFRDELISSEVTAMLLTVGLFNAYLEILSPLFRQLRYLLVGGEVLSPKKIQQVQLSESRPTHLINAYGPTESTTIATTYAITSAANAAYTIPIGRPIANTQIYILAPSGQPAPLGVVGEIYIGGAGVARGYLNRPELTQARFLPDRFSAEADARLYKTGDLGRWLPDGNIEYLGRNDFQVKLRGFRIELDEIESRLNQYPGINESIVIAREDIPGDKRLVAYVQTQPDIELIPTKLRQYLTQHLADYMLPSAFVMLDTFPLTPNGKLDRNALPAPDLSAVITRDYAEPVGDVETTLSEIWQNLLGLERVGRHDHFFELGGHSLIAVSLIEQLRNRGYSLEVRSVFATPLLADMAQAIQTGIDTPPVLIPPNRIPDECTAITPEMLPLVTLSQTEIDTIIATVTGGAANVQDIYPLSPLQEGILFHHQLQENSDAYLLNALLAFDTQARMETFLTALQQVIDRHDILRTAFCWQELSQPVQVVWRQTRLPVTPFIPTSPENISAQLQAHIVIPINITQAPLFAASTVYDPDSHEWLLGLRFHHLVSDHVTLELIMGEIQQLLQGEVESLSAPLPYRNFIAQMLSVPASEHEDYFRQRLGDIDEPTAPFGLLNVQADGTDVTEAQLSLEATLSQTLRALARKLGISPSVLFHVACAQVLTHTSGRDDVVFGTVLSGRLQGTTGADQVMGMFINTLPVRISLKNLSVLDVVQATAGDLAVLLTHEQAPLALAQRCSNVPPPMPLFNVLFNYRHNSSDSIENSVLKDVRLLVSEERTNYPLAFAVDDSGEDFSLVVQSVTGIDAERIVNYLHTALSELIHALSTDPRQLVQELPILPLSERQQLLVEFNNTQTYFPQATLTHELFEQQVIETPTAIAVVFKEQKLSYDELNRRANQLAHYLIKLGVKPDDRVAVCVERSPDMVVGLLAILKAGGAYVPLDPAYPQDRLSYMLNDAAPAVLLTQSALTEKLDNQLPTILFDEPTLYALDDMPDTNPDRRACGLNSRHLAYVIYTSGSTGQPKGVMIEHRNLCNLALSHLDILAAEPTDRVLQFASHSFDACIFECVMALLSGASLYLAERADILPGAALLRTLETYAITHLTLSPTALAAMDTLPTTLKTLITAGEACPLSQVRRWSEGRNMINGYGPTEITICATTYQCNSQDDIAPPIGSPIANTRIYILDPFGQLAPLGVVGEIYIGGIGVARGYLNRPELTAERFLPDPFSTEPEARMYKTGDLGSWLPNGNIKYLGRNDFQVKLRGFRIELGEIESQLLQCPGVHEAVVLAREDESTGAQKRLIAYILPQPGVELIPAELRQQLMQHLAEFMLPSAFVILDAFPLTPNGKLDRQALPAHEQSAVITRNYEAPVGDVETALTEIWQELLGLERVGRHDHFFELGGHSLIAVSLIERLRCRGYALDVRSVFSAPRLTDMAQTIQTQQNIPDSVVPPNRISADCTVITPDLLPLVTLSQEEIDIIVATVPDGAANVQDIYPLSPLQEGILFHHQLQESGDAYLSNSILAFDTRSRLEAFLAALQQVIDRHDILRTAFCWQGLSQPVQVVWRQAKLFVIPFIPTSAENIPAQLQANMPCRLDISQAPLFAASTTHDPDSDEWLLTLNFHHLVSDHVTLELIMDEIQQVLQGREESLPVPLPYRDFIAQTLSVPASVHENYFRQRLAGVDEPTAPFGLLNVQGNGTDVTEAQLSLEATLSQTLRTLARQLGISPSVLFHVAWAQVLAHTSGRDDVVFGTVLSGRLQGTTGADQVVGMFINTLPVRISLNNHTVLEVVQATAKDLADLLEHEQFPLALAQRCSGVTPPQPLFSALLNYRHTSSHGSSDSTDKPGWEGIRSLASEEWSNYPLDLSVDNFEDDFALVVQAVNSVDPRRVVNYLYPLDLSVDDLGDGFTLVVQAVNSVDPRRVVNYLYTALCGLTDALQNNPGQPVWALSILPVAERQQLLKVFNATQTDFLPSDALIHTLFEHRVQQAPDAIAIISEQGSLSYDELNQRANQLANALIAAGIRPDDRVALCVERCPDMMIGILGILKAGAAYVPLDPNHPDKRRAYILSDSTPKLLLTQQHLQPQAQNPDISVWLLDEADYLERVAQYAVTNPEPEQLGLQNHHLAYVIYTSGSTGLPKGVMVEHRNVVNFIQAQCQITALNAADRVLQFATIAFDASVAEIFPTLATGATLILRPSHLQIPDAAFSHFLQEQAISVVDIPTAFWHQWGQEIKAGRSGFSSTLRSITVGGEKTNLHSLVDWQSLPETQHCRWTDTYGPTETTVIVTSLSLNGGTLLDAAETLSIGRPIANCRIYLLDKTQQLVPPGVTGEIYIGGAGVARGYLNRSDLTAERFVADPFSAEPNARMYKTGDLGRWLPDGNIEYLGRNDFQVKIRGFRIEPGEIEAQLVACQGVRDAVVIAHKTDKGEQRLVAYLVPQPDVTLEAADLREQLRSSLADYMLPNAFVMLDTLPLTPSGKLDRKALPAPDLSAVITRNYEAPVGEVETALTEIWQELLGLERVGRHDHFFELGGHSLIAVSLIERLRCRGYALDVRSVFSAPRLTDMAQTIQTQKNIPDSVVPPNRISADCTVITPDLLPLMTLSQEEIDIIVATVPDGAANVQDIYPLSPLQEGILFHHQLQESGDAYLSNSILAFDTRARLEAFLAALQQVIDRHDILRTAFCWQGLSQPVQVVWRQAKLFVIPFIPTSAENIPAQLQANMPCRLDISQAPLFAASTTHDPDSDEWLLTLNFHHLVGDHVTLELIMDEIQQVLQGREESLPAPLPYRNFIAQTLNIPPSVHEGYFRERLAEIDEPTAPFGLLNVQGDGTDVTEAQLCLDISLAQTLRALARQLGISPSVLFHVAWAQVLAHTSGRDDVVFGTVLSGRLQGTTGADQVMGMFINTLPVRISLSNHTVLEVVQATAKDLADLLEHEQFPLALAQRCSGVISPLPLFSALLNYRHTSSHGSSDSTDKPGWEGIRSLASEEWSNYPLDLSVDDLGDGFTLVVQAVNSVDPRRVVNYLYTALCGLTDALQNNPGQPVWALSILPVAERQQLLKVFNATQTDFLPSDALIHTLFEHRVQQAPDAIAIISEQGSLSYDELNQRANQLANALIAAGIRPDDRVALCVERCPDMMIGILGILKAGAAYVPLDPNHPDKRRAYILSDSAPKLLLTQQHLQSQAMNPDIPVWLLDEADYLERVAQYAVTNPEPEQLGLQNHHLAYVIYTSGSTGLPKGVMVEHRNVVNFIQAQCQITALNAADRVLQFATIAFDASVAEIFPTLATGATLILRPSHLQIPDAAFSYFLQEQAISVVDIPTAFWHQWGQEIKAGRSGFSSTLRSITVGGEKTNLHSLVDWQSLPETQHCRWTDTYGPTETTVIVTSLSLNGGTLLDAAETLSIGRPIANCRIYLLDKTQQLVPPGVTGEIYIGGEGVARGYLNRSDLTAERFVADPFSAEPNARMYKTGDLGRWLPDGNIEYLGRNDFQVKIRGFRIEPGEIEAQLVACQGVRDAVVIAHKTDKGEQRLVAYLVPQPDVTLEAADLREQLRSSLADYMLPNAFVMLDTLPLTPSGKLDRQALPAPDLSAVITRNYEVPVGEVETALTEIWQELLGLERVGRHDHFFELGGHSLIAVSLIERLRCRGYALDVRSVFSAPRLTDMAQTIQTQENIPDSVVPPNRISADCTVITPDLLPLVTLSQEEIDIIVATIPDGAANVQDIYPLSPLQEGILFHHQLQESGDAYLSNSILAFNTRARLEDFLAALQQVIDRHDILRTAFYWKGLSQPVQVVWRQAKLFVIPFIPTSAENIPAQLQANMPCRLDISQAPLFAASTTHDPDSDEWLLTLNYHHLVSDHVTLELIIDEIQQVLQGREESLPAPLPYRNFIAQTLSVPASVHENYFRQRLAGVDEPTAPFGLLNVQGDGQAITEARLQLDSMLADTLRTLARQLGISPSVLFHVAWAQVLAHTSGRDDVVFGTVLSGRLQGTTGADQVMGMFINTLPIRISLSTQNVREAVLATSRDLAALLEHEQAPLALAQRCSGVIPPLPLFSVLLNYRHSPSDTGENPGWVGMRVLQSEERTNYPIALSVDDHGNGFTLTAQTVDGIAPDRVVHYLLITLSELADALTADVQQPVLSLSILPASERQQLLVDFNATQADFPQDALIHELFEQQVAQTPEAIAVVCEGQTLSYEQLNRQANQLAHYLIGLGIQPDDRVAICVERSPALIVCLLGILKAGGAYVPLDPTYPAERLTYMLKDAAPVILLTQVAQRDKLPDIVPVRVIDAQDTSSETLSLVTQPSHNPDIQALGLTSRHLAYVIYTSGSTGQPKGVMVEHRNVNRLAINGGYADIGPNDCVAHCSNIAFDASTWEIWSALLNGGRLHVIPQAVLLNPERFRDELISSEVTAMLLTVGLFNAYLEILSPLFRQLRYLLVGGEVLNPKKIQQVQLSESRPTHLINAYGPTETTTIATTYAITSAVNAAYTIPIGRPIANTQIYILDSSGQPTPLGVVGEIYIGGAGVARGYLNRPELTRARFLPDRFSAEADARLYKTGDLGRWLPDGNIEYLGRNDFQVKLRGFRIELDEIEARLNQYPGINESIVIAREDIPGDKRLVAYVQTQPDIELIPTKLRQYLTQHLADYMLPSAFVMLDTFPLTPNGKLDRKALPAPDLSAVITRDYEAPTGDVEIALAQIWQDLLGVERVGRYDHFFELGGHSLIAVRLINCMSKQGMAVSLATLFSYPILCDLAQAINSQSAKPSSPLDANPVPLSPEGHLPPLFLIHETTGDPLVYSRLATLLPAELPVYTLQAIGLHTVENPPASIEELATYHIDAIRRIQPHGPYRLAGWSIGGTIAYEIALQLVSDGEKIDYLGMIDSYNLDSYNFDSYNFSDHETDRQKDINLFIQSLHNYREQPDGDDLDNLYHFRDCEALQWLPADVKKEDILFRLNTQELILQLSKKYIISASSLPIHLYTCDDLTDGFDCWHGWHDIVGEHSERHPIGGGHYTIMQPPWIDHLADSMTEHLLPASYSPHIIIQHGDDSVLPLFCIPGAGASVSSFIELALALPPQLPVHALQARGLINTDLPPYMSVEGTARAYIKAIRQAQPHGPYYLLGHSYGGWLAFEIALQLQKQGEEIAALTLIDSDGPEPQESTSKNSPPKVIDRIETLMSLIDIYNMMLTQPLTLTRQDFENLTEDEQILLLLRALVDVELFPENTETSLLQGIVQVMQANLNSHYTPQNCYNGPVYLINAREENIDEIATRENIWRQYVTQLNTEIVPGNHMTMLSNPQVKQLATLLWKILREKLMTEIPEQK